MNHPNPMPNTSPARSAAHGHARAVKQPSPSERPAALDNLLAHITRRTSAGSSTRAGEPTVGRTRVAREETAQSTWTTAAACQAGAYGALDELAELTRRLAELVHLDPDAYDSTLDALHRAIDQATDQARERLRTATARHHAKETSDE